MAEVNYSKAMYDAIVKVSMKDGKMWVEMESEVPGLDIYYTIDGTCPIIIHQNIHSRSDARRTR